MKTKTSLQETPITFFDSFMVQEIHGDRDVTAVTSLRIEALFCPCDANANSNVKLLDQHHKLVEQNKVVMLVLFNQLVMLIT